MVSNLYFKANPDEAFPDDLMKGNYSNRYLWYNYSCTIAAIYIYRDQQQPFYCLRMSDFRGNTVILSIQEKVWPQKVLDRPKWSLVRDVGQSNFCSLVVLKQNFLLKIGKWYDNIENIDAQLVKNYCCVTNSQLNYPFFATFSNRIPNWAIFVKEFFYLIFNLKSDEITVL